MKSIKAMTRLVGMGIVLAVPFVAQAQNTNLLLSSRTNVHSLTATTQGTPSMPGTTWIRLGPLSRPGQFDRHSLLGPVFEYIVDPVTLTPMPFGPEPSSVLVKP
jgi:hypothetical protein